LLVEVVKLIYENLLERRFGAKLVNLMVNFVKDPCLIVVDGIVLYGLINCFFSQSVDNFNLVELNHDSTFGSTRYIVDLICLYRDLNGLV